MSTFIKHRFGTFRGLVRTALGYAELASGRLSAFKLRDPASVRRVVFVCHGNICRSAYAHMVANRLGMHVASLGLSTTTGNASPKPALAAAKRLGVDMSAHRACDLKDFDVQSGDLFLVMEVRQAHKLRRLLGKRRDVHVSLLGLWGQPPMPHLHDPYTLSDQYFDACFKRVELAVERLARALPQVRVRDGAPLAAAPSAAPAMAPQG
jgi:protein-tyrosine phosphatase